MSGSAAVITRETVKRLASDIADIVNAPIDLIHYAHSEDDILLAYALFIGPPGTPYEGGYYFFKINYPTDYPHSPPKFTFLTNNGFTRMNPNAYTDGKTCLSVLNSWHGDPWSGCQTIRSTLLSVQIIFNEEPLLNEPGYTRESVAFVPYQQSIQFMNIRLGMIDILDDDFLKSECDVLVDQAMKDFVENHESKMGVLEKAKSSWREYKGTEWDKPFRLEARVYSMNTKIDYTRLEKDLVAAYKTRSREFRKGKSK